MTAKVAWVSHAMCSSSVEHPHQLHPSLPFMTSQIQNPNPMLSVWMMNLKPIIEKLEYDKQMLRANLAVAYF